MMKFIKSITASMHGSFIPKKICKGQITKEIKDSLNELDYYGSAADKKNMREDMNSLNRDFNRANKEARRQFKLTL